MGYSRYWQPPTEMEQNVNGLGFLFLLSGVFFFGALGGIGIAWFAYVINILIIIGMIVHVKKTSGKLGGDILLASIVFGGISLLIHLFAMALFLGT